MPTIEIDFECYCAQCGAGICRNVDVKGHKLKIHPCVDCLEAAEDKGRDSRDAEVERLETEIEELKEQLEASKEKPE